MNKATKSAYHAIEASIYKEASDFNIKKVLVALSGGADSIATAYALKRSKIDVIALHCNFHLRGEESNRDTQYVTKFCVEHQIPLKIIDFDVEDYRKSKKGISIEMACRNLRHQWFEKQLLESDCDRIVTGHNADDNIETFLLNMLRGSGTRGLKGMLKDNGKIWRPLLTFHRKDIINYLEQHNLRYVVDTTNLESDYRRNFLRNKVIPLLKQEWKGFDQAMDKTIQNVEAENRIVENAINAIIPNIEQPLSCSEILASDAPLLLIKRFIEPYGSFSKTPEEVLSAIKANKPHIRRWRLKNGMLFLRNGNLFVEMSHGESCT